jgi:hypothetical protein
MKKYPGKPTRPSMQALMNESKLVYPYRKEVETIEADDPAKTLVKAPFRNPAAAARSTIVIEVKTERIMMINSNITVSP